MPAVGAPEAAAKSASKKKKKSKKKATDKTEQSAGEVEKTTADPDEEEDDVDDDNVEASRTTPVVEAPSPETVDPPEENGDPGENGLALHNGTSPVENGDVHPTDSDMHARLDAAEKDRETLRAEVAGLRQSLENIRNKHDEELKVALAQKNEAQSAKEKADAQYQTLLGRVNTIRTQLGDRLKADAEELSQARTQIQDLENKNKEYRKTIEEKDETTSRLEKESKDHQEELASIRSTSNISTTNWVKERDELNSQLAYAREEFDNAKQAMQDWEALAVEERSLRESLGERMGELEDQVVSHRDMYERVLNERDVLNTTIEGLQRALQEIQDARKTELREMVETSQAQLEALRKQADEAAKDAVDAAARLETTQQELARAAPFEREVKEKNLLIGKLRHEAVILNDHLTKALRFLKRGKPEDNVDRQVVTNHFLHFLALDRSDPKKFQILQLIAALLGWSDEQREQAGLSRPGASNAQLRVPLSPFRRTPSTPSLTTDTLDTPGASGSRESLAELWSDFLQREAEAGGGSQGASRRGSMAQSTRSFSLASPSIVKTEASGGLGIRAASSTHPSVPEES